LKLAKMEENITEETIKNNQTEDSAKYRFSIPCPTKESLQPIVDKKLEDLFKIANSDEGWEPINKGADKGIKAFKKTDPKSPIVMIKSTAELRCSANTLLNWCYNTDNVPLADPMYKGGEDVEIFDENNKIFHGKWGAPWPASPRDFVYTWSKKWRNDGYGLATAISILHPNYDEGKGSCKGYVRGELIETGFVLKDIGKPEDKKSLFTYILCINPRGWIPTSIVNMVAGDQALNCVRMKDYWDKNEDTDPKPPPIN